MSQGLEERKTEEQREVETDPKVVFAVEYGFLLIFTLALTFLGMVAGIVFFSIYGPVESIVSFAAILGVMLILFPFILPRRITVTRKHLIIGLLIPIHIELSNVKNIVHEQELCTEHTFQMKIKFATSITNRILVERYNGWAVTFSVQHPQELIDTVFAFRNGHTNYRPSSTQLLGR
ncbi:hypothetical protein PTSG_06076 [Salpingoeca rosetta]|uniref:Uncharacterized protein n=1 Tax=Salpingoeca rosetta (strain ATCC 50818 / BSB-021) TaxID=946362 RepID=F2UDM0_SALR5|nr:uncharacterized protein PTSG_06076 [Salpingoeca rosetta]EGD74715.1 hypothetical protein PTSG_06076 [Salpingoeca rosetta]|eukprot:XP_004992972.1 hypothetical protein PTSG_06076 [Salpingoeca rosetta]